MSSIRLFILDALERHGEVHGHQLRLLAEQEHVHLWTDISVGALYGALKRLAAEGLVAEVRTEREGSYPARQVYAVTPAGRASLRELRRSGLDQVVVRPDPFDLALCRPDPERLDELVDAVTARLQALQAELEDAWRQQERARPFLSALETHAIRHREHRLQAEIAWHQDLLHDLPRALEEERLRALSPEALPTHTSPAPITPDPDRPDPDPTPKDPS